MTNNNPADIIQAQCQALADRLQAKSMRLVTAESCTGGMIAAVCTDLAGSSQWFECGYVTYSNAAKHRDLGVPEHILNEHGAVSEETVLAMTAGAARYGDVAVSVSGIAGPGGAVTGKPVGTVWIACGNQQHQISELHCFDGDRSQVREQTVHAALTLLIKYMDK
jgi:nicotinamide-nucleotide amidase